MVRAGRQLANVDEGLSQGEVRVPSSYEARIGGGLSRSSCGSGPRRTEEQRSGVS